LGEENVGAEEQSVAKDRSFRNGVLLEGALQWLADLRIPSPFQKISANTSIVSIAQAQCNWAEHRNRKTARLKRLQPSTPNPFLCLVHLRYA